MLTLSDDRLRFSLFDSAKVEKKYDIDLSSVIHSYTIDGDSVRITLPYPGKMGISCLVYRETEGYGFMGHDYCEYLNEGNSPYSVAIDYNWDNRYYYDYGIVNQGSLGNDSISVHAAIYFRE